MADAQARGLFVFTGAEAESQFSPTPPPASPFCAFMSFVVVGGGWDSYVYNGPAQTFTLENDSPVGIIGLQSVERWTGNQGPISFEQDVISVSGSYTYLDSSFAIVDFGTEEIIAGVLVTGAPTNLLSDAASGAPIGAITYQAGLRFGVKLDPVTGTAQGYDNQGNAAALQVSPLYDPAQELGVQYSAGVNGQADLVLSPNTGSRAFALPESSGRYCEQEYIPPPLCVPATLTIQQAPPPNDQTMSLSGADDLDVNATSLGNTGLQSAAFAAANTFQTTTAEVKFELEQISDTTTGSSSAWGPIFIDFSTFGLLAGATVIKGSGVVFDIVGGAPIFTAQAFPDGYAIAAYIKADGSARMKDTNGNASALTVDGAYTNANAVAMGEVINAGDTVGETITLRNNLGSSAFTLGEDASRWCEV